MRASLRFLTYSTYTYVNTRKGIPTLSRNSSLVINEQNVSTQSTATTASSQCSTPTLPSCVNNPSIQNYLHLHPRDGISFPHHTPTSQNWPPVRSFQRNGHHEIDIFLSATITAKTQSRLVPLSSLINYQFF